MGNKVKLDETIYMVPRCKNCQTSPLLRFDGPMVIIECAMCNLSPACSENIVKGLSQESAVKLWHEANE